MQRRDERWELPGRKLPAEESWQEGLQGCKKRLKKDAGSIADAIVLSEEECYPIEEPQADNLEILIPCELDTQATPQLPPQFDWVALEQLNGDNCHFDTTALERMLSSH